MFTPDQYTQIAKSYDGAASDPLVPEDKRQEFAKRAEWFHYLAARGTGNVASEHPGHDSSPPATSSVAPYLTTLWIMGAALYLISTLLFTNAIGLFSDDNARQVSEVRPATNRELKTAMVDEKANPAVLAPERPHAISPNQPSYEACELRPPKATEQKPSALPVTAEPTTAAPPGPEPEMLKVTEAATIRNGPSTTAKVIGKATPGAELQVQQQQNGWTQFGDPSSGKSGWIQSKSIAEAIPPTAANPPSRTALEEVPIPQQKKSVRKAKMTPPRSKLGQRFADLPADEDFFADRGTRRKGLLGKRRMLREGLMSPGFRPPR
jgi:hypothetical protein